jgi:hypothetical protein
VSSAEQAVPFAPSAGSRTRPSVGTVVVIGLFVTLLLYIGGNLRHADPVTPNTPFPHSAEMERATGVQFSRVAVVGDGGLVMVEYVVQDVEKAKAFQYDRAHVPMLASQSRPLSTNRVSIMKPGHLIRPGQTYYFVYQNTSGALHSGERVTITYLDQRLADVPVL